MRHTTTWESMAPVDIKGLRRLYGSNIGARAVLDHFAARKNNSAETPVDRLVWRVRDKHQCSRREVIGVLQQLEKLGCGKFLIGRRGKQTRFLWDCELIATGRAAQGADDAISLLRPEEGHEVQMRDSDEEDKLEELADPEGAIRHTYNLRSDYTITLRLPADLTSKEAARFADFIKTLPFDDGTES